MKILIIVPKNGIKVNLLSSLNSKEREIRDNNTTFFKDAYGKWKHIKHPGSVALSIGKNKILNAEVKSKNFEDEWQILHAFIGYLYRYFSDVVESTTIVNR